VEAAVLAAAGGHNLLMCGSPGCGKTMIAQRIPSILPPLSLDESTEVTKIHSIAGTLPKDNGWVEERPFRTPHHNMSLNALIGGGVNAKPGEVSLAHHGVLFLDELPEYAHRTLEALRQPLEDGYVSISRVKTSHCYPSQIMLVAAMNPCPCGFWGSGKCTCTQAEREKYRKRISGPLLDRIDLHCMLKAVPISTLTNARTAPSSAVLQETVTRARWVQRKRFQEIPNVFVNGKMTAAHLQRFCPIEADALQLLERHCEEHLSSARNYGRILRVARTVADMNESIKLRLSDIQTALRYQIPVSLHQG
jgi:magnesium chelatase family protein